MVAMHQAASFEEWARHARGDERALRAWAASNAARRLIERPTEAMPVITRLLSDSDEGIRLETARSFRNFGWQISHAEQEAPAGALDALSSGPDLMIRAYLAGSRLSAPAERESALAVLKTLRGHSDPNVRSAAIDALGEDREPDSLTVAQVVDGLQDSATVVRCAAANALSRPSWRGKATETIPVLLDGLADPDPKIQRRFSSALVNVADREVLPVATLATLARNANSNIRIAVALLLQNKHMRSAEVVEILRNLAADDDREIRSLAANSLANRGWRSLSALSVLWRAFRAESRPFERWWLFLSMERVILPWISPLTMLTIVTLLLARLVFSTGHGVIRLALATKRRLRGAVTL